MAKGKEKTTGAKPDTKPAPQRSRPEIHNPYPRCYHTIKCTMLAWVCISMFWETEYDPATQRLERWTRNQQVQGSILSMARSCALGKALYKTSPPEAPCVYWWLLLYAVVSVLITMSVIFMEATLNMAMDSQKRD
ncbi:hypothetical protein Bbelb_100420 [Branchiostoma belcheri]|nr:hypothetical protein Bbelb_100420 [Branchiostoma belcheri]